MREKLIELIAQKVCCDYSPTCDEWQPHDCGKCYANDCRIADLADHLIANGVTIAEDNNVPIKWISVKDRLPDKHGKPYVCLLRFPEGGQFPYILNWYEYGDNGYVTGRHFQDEGVCGLTVTHWMPLPEPPKGDA